MWPHMAIEDRESIKPNKQKIVRYRSTMHTVGSQPKVKGLRVKTLDAMDAKIIRSKPWILSSKVGRNFGIQMEIVRNLIEFWSFWSHWDGSHSQNFDHNGPTKTKA